MNASSIHRIAHWCYRRKIPIVPTLLRNLIFVLFNSYIPPSAKIGRGTVFAYGAIGVVLHADTEIGERCVIGQGVTIGASEGFFTKQANKCPIIGDNTYIGAGARILGDIRVGNSCQIGAGAVLLTSIDDHSIAVGMPAKVIGRNSDDFLAIRP